MAIHCEITSVPISLHSSSDAAGWAAGRSTGLQNRPTAAVIPTGLLLGISLTCTGSRNTSQLLKNQVCACVHARCMHT